MSEPIDKPSSPTMSQEQDTFNDAELTEMADEIMQDTKFPLPFDKKIKLSESTTTSNTSSSIIQLNTPPPTKLAPKTPSPSIKAPSVPFMANSKYWGKSIKILSKEYSKTRVKIEWLFVLKNVAHSAVMTHSQKKNASVPSSRELYVDGMRLYSNRVTDTVFTTKMNENTLRFKIEKTEHNYRYILSINDVPHSVAYKQWQQEMDGKDVKIVDANDQKRNNKAKNDKSASFWSKASNKSNWFNSKNKNDKLAHLPVIPVCVPDQSFEDSADFSSVDGDKDEYNQMYKNASDFVE